MLPLDDLRAKISGPVLTADEPGFAEEVAGFSLTARYAPEVAVGVTTEADVVEAIAFAARHGLRVHVQATGHGAPGLIAGGMLIVTKRLTSLSVNPVTEVARIGAGVRWGEVIEQAGTHGLAPIAGSSASVGAIGYLLGGGLGPLARSHGFSSDYVLGVRVVNGDGVARAANEDQNADLFWALRGGKAGLGVVTQVDLGLMDLPQIFGGALFFDAEHIDRAFRGWLAWTTTASTEVSTSAAILRFPSFEQVPAVFRGKTMLSIRFAYPGDVSDGEELAAPLRALAPLALDTIGVLPTTRIAEIHSDPEQPAPSWVRGVSLRVADDDFASAVLELVGADSHPPIVSFELRHLGGQVAVDVVGGSAVGGRSAAFTLGVVAITPEGTAPELLPNFWGELMTAVSPWTSAETTINFAGNLTGEEFARSWSTETFARLSEVAAQYDPAGLFRDR